MDATASISIHTPPFVGGLSKVPLISKEEIKSNWGKWILSSSWSVSKFVVGSSFSHIGKPMWNSKLFTPVRWTAYAGTAGLVFSVAQPALSLIGGMATWVKNSSLISGSFGFVGHRMGSGLFSLDKALSSVLKPAMEFGATKIFGIWNEYMTFSNVTDAAFQLPPLVAKGVWQAGVSAVTQSSWKLWGTIGIYAAATFAFTYGAKILEEVIDYRAASAKEMIGDPKLNIEYYRAARLSSISRFLSKYFPKKEESIVPTFNEDLQEQIDHLKERNKNTLANGGPLCNVVMSGPPGTGKTMVARVIAKQAGYNCVVLSGADLQQYIHKGKAVSEFNKIIERAKDSKDPTVIVIDEAETLLANREGQENGDELDQPRRELVNAILKETGASSDKVMLIVATNDVTRIDAAFLSRADFKLEVGLPNYNTRVKILSMYAKEDFKDQPELKTTLNEKAIQRIAAQTPNLSGRTLSKLITYFKSLKLLSPEKMLTEEMVDKATKQFVLQERGPTILQRSWRVIKSRIDSVTVSVKDVWYLNILYIFRKCRRFVENGASAIYNGAKSLNERAWKQLKIF